MAANSSITPRGVMLTGIGVSLIPTFVVGPDVATGHFAPMLTVHWVVGHAPCEA